MSAQPLASGIGQGYLLTMDASRPSTPRSVVLVHGMWGRPGDWQWVQRRLEDRGVGVLVPDLPSHRLPDAGFLDDVEEVKAAIRSSAPPTCVAGWSYGADVIGVAAEGEANVARLVYVSSVPQKIHPDPRDGGIFDGSPIMVWDDQDRFVLNDAWKEGRDFRPEVWEHYATNPLRAVTRRTLSDPIPAAAWEHIPTTILLGNRDDLNGEQQRVWAREAVADVRDVDSDHFVPHNIPEIVADVLLEDLPVPQPH
ncbi:alpha/beta hydrolase [Arthrobacter sp. MI7-26]|uniref:alpha/beta hydrolase n=1 Tax=Arthrobacter sp. MI7-26 TaxID=2993653 RepID=UPI0022489FD7|nr:alpha/beta hydrolase [Arthrobacter sp. MI7-26]MCX2750089.1 alpha/beta hydrolase [Arthrobacter sp. MI7-26]